MFDLTWREIAALEVPIAIAWGFSLRAAMRHPIDPVVPRPNPPETDGERAP